MTERRTHRIKRNKMTKAMIRSTVYALCLIGCSCHLILCTIVYFKYLTKASLATYIPFEQTMPYVTFCIPRGTNVSTDMQEACKNFVINQSTVIRDCSLRNFTSRRVDDIDCSRGFIVTQSTRRSNSYTCYTIRARKNRDFNVLEAIALRVDRRKLYKFTLTKQFEEQREMLLLMHFNSDPHSEYRFSTETYFGEGSKNVSLSMGFKMFEAHSLPAPYDTKCVEESICTDSCGRRHKWCKNVFCQQNVTITYATRVKSSMQGIFVDVQTVSSPTTKVNYTPREDLSAFILQVCSLLGIWLGVSVHLVASTVVEYFSNRSSKQMMHVNQMHWRQQIINLSRRAGVEIQKTASRLVRCSGTLHMRRRNQKRWIAPLAKVAIILLFIRELTLISIDYFKYAMIFETDMKLDAFIKYPSISYCFDVPDWFNKSRRRARSELLDEEMTMENKAFNLTLKQIFDGTPHESTILKKCTIRTGNSSPLMQSSNCNEYFKTSKYSFGEFICYYIEPRFKLTSLNDNEGNSSTLYSIVPSDQVARMGHYQAIVSDGLPDISRYLVSESWKQSKYEALNMDFKMVQYSLLPPPFSTGCSSYLTQSITKCRETCWNYARWNRVPFSLIIDKPVDLPLVSYVDMKNVSFVEQYVQAEEYCDSLCGLPCEGTYTNTYHEIDESTEYLQLIMGYPKYPVYQFKAVPMITVFQYVYQIFCSASFWIGFSFVNCIFLICCLSDTEKVSPASDTLSKMMNHLEQQIKLKSVKKPVKRGSCIIKKLKCRMMCIFYSVLLFLGFCVHCFIICSQYFCYPTVMNSWVSFESNYTDLRTLVCISLDQLTLNDEFTLQDIWANSPPPDQVILECGYRGVDLPELSSLPKSLRKRLFPFINSTKLCQSIFRVEKFVSLGLACYNIKPLDDKLDPEYRMQYQITLPRIYGFIILTSHVSRFNLTVSVSQGPFANSLIMPSIVGQTYPTKTNQYYFISYVKFYIDSLPYPYQMGVYDSLKKITCMRNCVSNRLKERQLFSSYSEAKSPDQLSYESDSTESLDDSRRTRKACEVRCETSRRYNQQTDVYFDTFDEGPYNSIDFFHLNGTIGLWLSSSDQVVTKTSFLPQFRFVDLVLYVGSIFAIWFGFPASKLVDMATSPHERRSNAARNILCRLNKIDSMISSRESRDFNGNNYTLNQWSYIRRNGETYQQERFNFASRKRMQKCSVPSAWKQMR